ncbi:RNA ligase family protein [Neobacillus notoginsengisoli]|nr:RNA ligase family protein [Neobacillus notoginsengisoli]
MLLHKFTPPFSDFPWEEDQYISELKLDGIRILVSKFDDKIKVYTRHHNEVTSIFPELQSLKIPNGTIVDGEIVVTDDSGKPVFEEVMSRFLAGKNGHQRVQYCIFDIIYYKGQKITSKPLVERKEILESIIIPNDTVTLVQWSYGSGEVLYNLTKEQGLEGVVFKRVNSIYKINKRSHDWLKAVHYSFAVVHVMGLRKDKFGLLLGLKDNGKLRPAGVMEFMTPSARKQFYLMQKDLVVNENNKFIYLEPKIKLFVKFRNFTKDGKLRIPSFVEFVS